MFATASHYTIARNRHSYSLRLWYNCESSRQFQLAAEEFTMTQVTVDESLKQRLGGLDEAVELCGPDGKVVGRYLPEGEYRAMLYSSVEIPFSDEEIARRRSETGGCSLEEIWKRVGRT